MSSDKTIPIIFFVVFLVIALPVALFFRKAPAATLTASEKELIAFSYKPVSLTLPPPQTTFPPMVSPVRATPKQSGDFLSNNSRQPPAASSTVVTAQKALPRSLTSLPVVSMIYFAGSTRMAIIDNHVVNEGSPLNGGIVAKIEQTRVLVRKAGKDIWLTTN